MTAPDTMRVSGTLAGRAVASVHVAAVPWAGGGVRMVLSGREGTRVATGNVSSQRGEMLRVHGAKRRHELSEMARSDPETEAGVGPLGQRFPTISLNWR